MSDEKASQGFSARGSLARESGGIALLTTVFRSVAGKRLLFRPLTGTSVAPPSIGIARATEGDVTPAGEKFCEILQ